MTKPTEMYFIYAYMDHEGGDNADLIVEALSLEQAASLWREHFELDKSEGVIVNIFKVPERSGTPHALCWGDILEHWPKPTARKGKGELT
jgi:hypothetical protein